MDFGLGNLGFRVSDRLKLESIRVWGSGSGASHLGFRVET